jgi:large subunit ribosomal protein L10
VKKEDKTKAVEELTERLRSAETLIVADYRGLKMTDIDALRGKLLEQGAKFSVVKNTLTRRAAEAAGNEALLAMLEGPTAIAFLEAGGDPVAVAKTIADAARDTRILAIRGGVLEGKPLSGEEIESLAKLPPVDVVRGQVLGAIIAPLTALHGLVTAPLQNLYGLIDARIEQLGGAAAAEEAPAAEAAAGELSVDEAPEPVATAEAPEGSDEETTADATASASEGTEQTIDQAEEQASDEETTADATASASEAPEETSDQAQETESEE